MPTAALPKPPFLVAALYLVRKHKCKLEPRKKENTWDILVELLLRHKLLTMFRSACISKNTLSSAMYLPS